MQEAAYHSCGEMLMWRRGPGSEEKSRRLDRLGNIEADGDHRQAPAQADADRRRQRLAEIVDGIADVGEDGDAELARQVALDFEGAGQQVAAADAHLRAVGSGLHRRQRVVGEAADAAVAAGIEAEDAGQVLEIADRAGADLAAQQQVPALGDVQHPLGVHVQAQEVGIRAEHLVGADQLGVQRAREQLLAEVAFRHRGVGDAGHDQVVDQVAVDGIIGDGMREAGREHALPASETLRDAGCYRILAGVDAAADLLLLGQECHREFFQHRVADRHVVARIQILADLRDLQLHPQPVATIVDELD